MNTSATSYDDIVLIVQAVFPLFVKAKISAFDSAISFYMAQEGRSLERLFSIFDIDYLLYAGHVSAKRAMPWALGPIVRLPAEILLQIFVYIALWHLIKHKRKQWSLQSYDWYTWLTLPMVCRYWEVLVCHNRKLWRLLYWPASETVLAAQLKNSMEIPLCVVFDQCAPGADAVPLPVWEALRDGVSTSFS